ncbi:hypothetical protein ACGFMM_21720 [Streptomyces sp. NPDC048604]|uniref:hypothetical protein n=1 Tax=Streptomyces sp. NPDC048604 TaxID=3365578 RepID=UPI003720C6FC
MRQVTQRLRDVLVRGVTAATTGTAVLIISGPAAVAVGPGPGPGGERERQDQPPACGKASDPEFPIDTRIHGGPAVYRPGEGFATWNVELTNTTDEACDSIHPVLALTDRDRVLRAGQIRFDFYDAHARRWRPVEFEVTEEDENVGVFDDGFPGFAVPAGRTLTVPVRLAFRAGTAPNEVVANTAIVQRRGDDGDWVGESDDYRLVIGGGSGGEAGRPTDPPKREGDDGLTGNPVPPVAPTVPTPLPPELAQTGSAARRAAGALAIGAGAAVVAGVVLMAIGRRRRR